ncbi:hypothetical protein VTP01DRAFT_3514 [Rhizomucor pusillus]|uniref:uncharacterized protein n=1 Tax=Rhizomucor pusillus TaxID=4840 RepID=UPI003743BA21
MSSEMNEVTITPDKLREIWSSAQEARENIQQWAQTNGGFYMYIARSSMSGEKRYIRLGCGHSGVPRNQEGREDTKATFIADVDGNVTVASQGKKQRARDSQRFDCPFEVMLRPLNKDSCQWHAVAMQKEHNHAVTSDTAVYPMHRRLEGEAQENVINMIKAHAGNSTIVTYLKGLGIAVVSKDISNLRQKIFNNDPDHGMFRLIQARETDGYRVGYSIKQEGDKRSLRSLFFALDSVIELAIEFPEIISLDAT